MDAQKQEKLKRIKNHLKWNDIRSADMTFLLQLVREQEEQLTTHAPEGHNYTNGQYVELLLEHEQLKAQLAKYERVVETAKRLISKARDNKTVTGDNEQPDWYEYTEEDFEALMNAVDDLKA